jgi:predicted RNase H-like HicB family nuclease
MAHGATSEEAVANLAFARRLCITALLEREQEVPLPTAPAPGPQ